MAAASSMKYDVFISFRGEDTRNTFTCHLYKAFRQKKIQAYIDEEDLEKGDEISPALTSAIQESKISVVIFSTNYATSSWCLEELSHILQCKETNKQLVIPVFYNVEPTHVRHQTGSYEAAFIAHEHSNKRKDKVPKWKNALTTVSNLSGFHSSSATRPDTKLVEEIVKDVMQKLNRLSPSNNLKEEGLVGMDERIEQFESLLNIDSQEVRIVGIWGIGGIGKTTLARAFFDRFASQFEGICFLENVKGKRSELTNLQKQLFSKLLGEESLIEANKFANDRLQRTKAFVVLDDVDSAEQLEYLVEQVLFGPGSKIIITTRDSQVLNYIPNREIYPVEGLNFEEALQLFCSKAFRRNAPPEGYESQSRRVVQYARGLPLALKVLGSHLCSESPESPESPELWESTLDDLEKCLHKVIHEVLRISYDGLDRSEQEMFLDIACFFNGDDKKFVERKLHVLNRNVEKGIKILKAKSLITLERNSLCTHDLLKEMGWKIVREESYNEPGKRSRLWLAEDIYHVLKNNTGTEVVKVMSLDPGELENDIDLNPLVFKDMFNLEYLSFDNFYESPYEDFNDLPDKYCDKNYDNLSQKYSSLLQYYPPDKELNLPQGLLSLPDKLRYLRWPNYPLGTLPPNFMTKNLVELNMQSGKLEKLWDGIKSLESLKVLDLSFSENLIEIPNLSKAVKLEIINLCGCESLEHLPSSICKLKSLQHLHLLYCSKLEYLPEISEPMPNVRHIILFKSGIKELPTSIYNLIEIEYLDLDGCKNLKSLPTSICKLKSLKRLELRGCSKLQYLPDILEPMPNLQDLCLRESGILELPTSIHNLIEIEYLDLDGCKELKSLPTSICKLKSLKRLKLQGCSKLQYLPDNLEQMRNLMKLCFHNSRIRKLPTSSFENLTGIFGFKLFDCKNLELSPHTIYHTRKLLHIGGCPKLKSLPRPFLSSGTNLVQSLCLRGTSVSRIPNNLFSCLNFLLNLELSRSNIRRIPENIKFAKLFKLDIRGCRFLQSLPELPLTVEKVDASGCMSLKMVSNLLTALTQPPTDRVNLGVTFSFKDCLKLEHQNIMSEFQMRASLIATALALRKTPYKVDHPTTKMCYPGDNIPEWFSYQKTGRSINIRLPYISNLMGFAFCFILSCKKYKGSYPVEINLDGEIYVKTIYGDERHLPLPLQLLPSNTKNHVSMTTFMCNVENFYSAVEMSFNFGTDEEADVKIKRCGIRLLHVQDAMEFGIISSHYVCRKSKVINDEGGPSLFWESILVQLRHFQVSSSRKKLCEKIWSSNLNHQYKILWWQLLRDALPVRAVLNHVGDTSCPLCGSGMESAIHLFLFCKRVQLLWFMSQWPIRTDSLLCDSMASFLEIVLDRGYDRDFLVYASLLVDSIWEARNKLVYDGRVFHFKEIHSSVQAQFNQISTSKRKRKWRSLTLRKSCFLNSRKFCELIVNNRYDRRW